MTTPAEPTDPIAQYLYEELRAAYQDHIDNGTTPQDLNLILTEAERQLRAITKRPT
jgi:hypothetical protein